MPGVRVKLNALSIGVRFIQLKKGVYYVGVIFVRKGNLYLISKLFLKEVPLVKVKQISIFLENKSGRLANVTKVLGDNGVNIRALSIADTTDFGILRLIVSDPEKAWNVLKTEGFTVSSTEVIAVQIPDQPGGLASVLASLESLGVNIEYMYAFVGKSNEEAVVVFRVESIDQAIPILQKGGVRLLKGEEVYNF